MINISNIIKIRLNSPKNNIRSTNDARRIPGQISGSHAIIFVVEDSYAPIFEEVNIEIVLECLRMYESNQEMALVCLSLPKFA